VPIATVRLSENVQKDFISNTLKKYRIKKGEIEELKISLYEDVKDFLEIDNELTFNFQSDFPVEILHRGKKIQYPTYYKSHVRILFLDKAYYFFFSEEGSSIYISNRIEKILDTKLEKLGLNSEKILDIVADDFVKINSSWWKKIGEDLKSAFLSGKLKDGKVTNDIYKLIEERAGTVTYINYLSKYNGHNIGISIKKDSIIMKRKDIEIDDSEIVRYFKAKIYPSLIKK
jgi:hypothetical protein